ncbi:MAG: class I SAM-dependent methyltransferase [Candidatus Wallbacteria bacterium]|nr:class I SAM-dependent methyltransferase [Candidatus Wallbacteria bacterium]
MEPYRIDETEISRHGPGNLLAVCWKQWRAERALAARGIHFRTTDPTVAEAAYAAMTAGEFEAVNGRQAWANWRTIPRALSGNIPEQPLLVVDLGCGTGPSTSVLAFYCPAGSRVIGYELAEPLVRIAGRRSYPDRAGRPAQVTFVAQPVTKPLCDASGVLLGDGSVDVVNASGIVGHHFTEATIGPLVDEIRRVLSQRGIAMLDVGPTLGEAVLTRLMDRAGFVATGRYRSWPFDPTGEIVFRRSGASANTPKVG